MTMASLVTDETVLTSARALITYSNKGNEQKKNSKEMKANNKKGFGILLNATAQQECGWMIQFCAY